MSYFWGIVVYIRNIILLGSTTKKRLLNSKSVPMTIHIPCKEGMRRVQGILAGLRALSKFYMVDKGF